METFKFLEKQKFFIFRKRKKGKTKNGKN